MRARGIGVVALLVAWLGVIVAFLSLARPVREWAAEWWPVYATVGGVHCVAAWVAAYGLCEGRAWGPVAFRAWSAAGAVAAFLPWIVPRQPLAAVWPGLLGALIVGALLIGLNRYVGRLGRG